MSRIPNKSRPSKNPVRPLPPEQFLSYESHMCIIKKGGRIFVAEVATKISEIKTTSNNVIQFPHKGR